MEEGSNVYLSKSGAIFENISIGMSENECPVPHTWRSYTYLMQEYCAVLYYTYLTVLSIVQYETIIPYHI